MIFFQTVLSILMIIFLGWIILRYFKKGELVSLPTLLALFAIVDVFLPAIIGALTGKYQNFSYYNIDDPLYYLLSVIIYSLSVILFCFGFFCGFGMKNNTKLLRKKEISEKRLLIVFVLAFAIIILFQYFEYKEVGSFQALIEYKFKRTYLKKVEYTSFFKNIVSIFYEFSLPLIFIVSSIGLLNNKKYKKPIFWKFICPSFALLSAILTTYRGAILEFAVMILISLQLSINEKDNINEYSIKKNNKRIVFISLIGVAGFIIYGGIRNILVSNAWGRETNSNLLESILVMFTETFGTSLSSLARCIKYVDDGNSLFLGQSIFEMFYSIIPRSIMPNKPVAYGLISLTTAMGSPSSTMDATTIPGEIILNFGYFGLIIVPFIGFIYAKIYSLKNSDKYKYLYAAIAFSLVSTPLWMSFTGFFAKVKYLPILIIIICFMVVKKKYVRWKINEEY